MYAPNKFAKVFFNFFRKKLRVFYYFYFPTDINECLQETLPCGPGASCQNLLGWYKCSCPLPLIGNAYSSEGCRLSVPICFTDENCKENQKCNPITQECYGNFFFYFY